MIVYLNCKEYGFNDNITMYEFGVVTVDCLSDAQDQLFEAGSGLANQLGQVGLAQVCRDDYFEHRHHHLNVGSVVHVHLQKDKIQEPILKWDSSIDLGQ